VNAARTLLRHAVVPVGLSAALLGASRLDPVGTAVAHTIVVAAVAPTAVVSDLALAASVGQVIDNLRNWIIGILAGLATLFLTIGATRYVMAGGDPAEVERARAALRSAAFGYALAVLAPLVVQVLKSIVGA
jgi:hypothetical protein